MSQPPPMKLWEAVSAFREFQSALTDVFGSERWRAPYGGTFSRLDELVRTQDRAALDSPLPIELTRELARRCDGFRFHFSPDTGWLRRATPGLAAEASVITLTALEVHDRFGGSVIEEVREHGSARIAIRAA